MEINFYKLFDSFIKILGFVLHVESSPIYALDVLEPFVADELRPHCQTDSCSSSRFEDADTISLISEDHADMINLRICEESLNFGKEVTIFKEDDISSLAISIKLCNSSISILNRRGLTSIQFSFGSYCDTNLYIFPLLSEIEFFKILSVCLAISEHSF